jgi:hypothetical protein
MNDLKNPATRNMRSASFLECVKFVFTLGRKGALFVYTAKDAAKEEPTKQLIGHESTRQDGIYWASIQREDAKKIRLKVLRVAGNWVLPDHIPDGIYEILEISKKPIETK